MLVGEAPFRGIAVVNDRMAPIVGGDVFHQIPAKLLNACLGPGVGAVRGVNGPIHGDRIGGSPTKRNARIDAGRAP